MLDKRALVLVWGLVAPGCRTPPWAEPLPSEDLAAPVDLAVRDAAAPDLAIADLGIVDLRRADLSVPDLSQRDLRESDLATPAAEVCVANQDNTVEAFASQANGNAAPLRRFGDLTKLSGPISVAMDPVNNEIVVSNFYSRSITVYARTVDGTVAPVRQILGPSYANSGGHEYQGVAVDPVNDEIFLCDMGAIVVYPRTGNGIVAPLRVIIPMQLDGGAWSDASWVAVDAVHDELLASDGDAINVYSRTASGSALPIRRLAASNMGVAVDPVHDEILLARNGISIYPRTATGLPSPLRQISGAATGLSAGTVAVAFDRVSDEVTALVYPSTLVTFSRTADGNVAPLRSLSIPPSQTDLASFAVDPTHGEIAVTTYQPRRVSVYARTASGSDPPLRAIDPGPPSGLAYPWAIVADTLHDEILVSNGTGNGHITVYPRSSNGVVTPLRTISIAGSNGIRGLALDPVHDEVFAAAFGFSYGPRIAVVPRTGNGQVTPLRTIASSSLDGPVAVAVDTVHDEVLVINRGSPQAILAFPRGANGTVSPLRTVSGAQLDAPLALVVDPLHDEILVAGRRVQVYARTATGNAVPLRTISAAGLSASSLALDRARDEIFAINDARTPGIMVFARTANGTVDPLRSIAGPATYLYQVGPDGNYMAAFITICR